MTIDQARGGAPGVTLYRVLCYTSLIFGVQGILRTLTAILFLGLRPDPVVLGIAFAMPVFIYGRDRLLDVGADDALPNRSARARWTARHSGALRIFVFGAGAACLLLMLARPAALGLLLAMMGFALTYTVRWLPGGRSPKQLPGFKTPYVTAIWTALVVALPLTVAGEPWDARAALLAAVMFLLTAPYTVINDVYDIHDDRRTGTRSLPAMFGERAARLASCLMSLSAAGVAAIGLGSPGLALAGCYGVLYCGYAESRRGPEHGPTVLMYRAHSVIMVLLVALFE
jgi:4-hydroxybenzoate polyprenyltransferase